MDRVLYIAMTGAREATRRQALVAHNLANVDSTGFKQQLAVFRALPVVGEGARTRAFVLETTPATDFSPGPVRHTGRPLDVAVRGSGFIAVQDVGGGEAYTRAGALEVGPNGLIQTVTGHIVLGDGGPIAVPPEQEVMIAADGTVSTIPPGENRTAVAIAGRIRLVNPPEAHLVRGEDGLFRSHTGTPIPADANVRLTVGALEASNVNPAEALVQMISASRQFELQMRLIRSADENARAADKLIARV
ncbi:MAG: flagellar basal body rod protein FlgF [Thiobacillaceae bacterium]|nr:flagellar basal body rod protein FlgF [Thiobacillaceae bacterium]